MTVLKKKRKKKGYWKLQDEAEIVMGTDSDIHVATAPKDTFQSAPGKYTALLTNTHKCTMLSSAQSSKTQWIA